VRFIVDYRYYPGGVDVLEQRRDKVKLTFTNGSCVVQSREVESTLLERVDSATDGVDFSAPVGRIDTPTKTRPTAKTVAKPSNANPKAAKKKALEQQQKVAPPPTKSAQQAPYTKGNDSGSQIVPQPQAPAPQATAQDLTPQQAAPRVKK